MKTSLLLLLVLAIHGASGFGFGLRGCFEIPSDDELRLAPPPRVKDFAACLAMCEPSLRRPCYATYTGGRCSAWYPATPPRFTDDPACRSAVVRTCVDM